MSSKNKRWVSQAERLQFNGGAGRYSQTSDSAFLVEVNLALRLWTDFYLTPYPMMDQPPSKHRPEDWLSIAVCLQEGERVQMSLCIGHDPELDS